MIRSPAVAGRFYPGDKAELQALVESLLEKNVSRQEVIGAVLPHAGYIFSGKVAAMTISCIDLKDTAIIIGPNHTGMGKPFAIMTEGTWQTPLGETSIDSELARHIRSLSRYLEDDTEAHQYEHSLEVQLPFIQYIKPDVKIVPIVVASAPGSTYKEIGWAIARAIQDTSRPSVIFASSDMTHYEPDESAREKDSRVIQAIVSLDEDRMLETVKADNVSMCGYGPVACLIRAARELGASEAELVKYQTSAEASGDYSSVVGYSGIIIKARQVHNLVDLAKQAVEMYVRERKIMSPPDSLSPEMEQQAGVFVSLHAGPELRGCIGTFLPARENIAREIITNAISAATADPRFAPVAAYELPELEYSVDVLTRPEPVGSESELDPGKYGVIVEAGSRRGLLLPDLEGVDSVEKQIEICRMKAGIGPGEQVKLYRFEVKRYK